jgi:hypothetical protein
MEWARILAYITGTVDQQLLLRNEYLVAENRILKAQLHGRLRLSDAERARLGEIGHRLGRKALSEVATAALPETILTLYRTLVARKFDGSRAHRRPGRPPIDEEVEELIVGMAKENRSWGYDRIVGALANLGYRVSDQTVGHREAQLEYGWDLEGEVLEYEVAETRKREVEGRTKAVDTRLEEIRWPLSVERERTAANRAVLAARLVAEPRVGVEQDEHHADRLADALRAAVKMLARHGRPTSQVKMLWAWRDAGGAIPLEAIEPPLRSRIGWVRDQALQVFGALAPSRRDSETTLMKELEYDFANGSLLKRGVTYLKASKGRLGLLSARRGSNIRIIFPALRVSREWLGCR